MATEGTRFYFKILTNSEFWVDLLQPHYVVFRTKRKHLHLFNYVHEDYDTKS